MSPPLVLGRDTLGLLLGKVDQAHPDMLEANFSTNASVVHCIRECVHHIGPDQCTALQSQLEQYCMMFLEIGVAMH